MTTKNTSDLINDMVNSCKEDNAESIKSFRDAKVSEILNKNRNLIGGLIGVGVAVGLELASPTGSKASAVLAGIAGGGVLYFSRSVVSGCVQNSTLAALTGVTTAYVGIIGGRLGASYFPGNLNNAE